MKLFFIQLFSTMLCLFLFTNGFAQSATKKVILGRAQQGMYYTNIENEILDTSYYFNAIIKHSGDQPKFVISAKSAIKNLEIRYYDTSGYIQYIYEDPSVIENTNVLEIDIEFFEKTTTHDILRITVNGITNYYTLVVVNK